MTATYQIYPDLNLKYVEITGKTHLTELRDLAVTYFEDPAFSTQQRQLIDLTHLVDARARFIDVFTLRNFYMRKYGRLENPVVVSINAPTELGYAISKMFAMLMVGQKAMKVQIFSTMSETLESLDISPVDAQVFLSAGLA